jgi:hypothetical protein
MGSGAMKRTVTILLALLMMAGSAQALISPKVGPLLKEAQAMIAAKNYKAASAKLDEANAVKSVPDDTAVIDQFRRAIAKASSQPSQP